MHLPFSGLEIIKPEQAEALFQFFQLYYYENSDWAAEDIGSDGLFDACAASIADYVHNPAKSAYWIRKDDALAGFVVTEPITLKGKRVNELADLFVLKRYRRQGLALASVRELARKFDGPWIVAVYHDDTRAAAFWRKAFATLPVDGVRPFQDPELQQFMLFAVNEP